MRRIFMIVLVFVMLFSFCACSAKDLSAIVETQGTTDEAAVQTQQGDIALPKGFSVGFGRREITPKTLPIYTFQGKSATRIDSPLYATSVAVSDGENVVLFISIDSRGISDSMVNIGIKRLSNTYHIPAENIILTATHTHAGVDIARETQVPVNSWFTQLYSTYLPGAVEDSLRDLAPATLSHGQSHVEACHNRRYLMSDNSWLSNRYPEEGVFAVGHESEVDDVMNVLYFEREGKKPVSFVNFQCHPSTADWETISADWIHTLRKNVEEKYDALFSYYQGAAGVLMHKSIIEGELNLTRRDEVGDHFSKAYDEAFRARVPANTGKIRVASGTTRGEFISVSDEEWLQLERYNATSDEEEKKKILPWFVANCRQKIKKYHAKGVTELALPHIAVSFGDVGIVTASYELFHETGLYVKENSPFKITLTFGYTNGNNGYIPPRESFEHGEYEVESCIFVPGTAEACGDTMKSLLEQVAK